MADIKYHEEDTLRQIYDNLRHYGIIVWDREYSWRSAYRVTMFEMDNEKIVVFMVNGTIKFVLNLTKHEEHRLYEKN